MNIAQTDKDKNIAKLAEAAKLVKVTELKVARRYGERPIGSNTSKGLDEVLGYLD